MTARYFGLVPAAGSGTRFGNAGPKQYSPLAGKPMLHHSIARLLAAPEVEIVFVVLPPADREFREHDWSAFGEGPSPPSSRGGGAPRPGAVMRGRVRSERLDAGARCGAALPRENRSAAPYRRGGDGRSRRNPRRTRGRHP